MKKYFISVLIPYMLLYLSGCYSMQEVTKEEFSPAPDYPELHVKTKDNEYTFEEGNYIFINDTIYGKGKIKYINYPYEPFEGTISIYDVEDLQIDKSANTWIIKTKDREFIFKNEEVSHSIKNDTIYGIGKYRLLKSVDQFEGAVTINESEKISINQFNLGATIALVSILVLSVAFIVAMISSFKLEDEDIWRSIGN
jgi:hypothetical protein